MVLTIIWYKMYGWRIIFLSGIASEDNLIKPQKYFNVKKNALKCLSVIFAI